MFNKSLKGYSFWSFIKCICSKAEVATALIFRILTKTVTKSLFFNHFYAGSISHVKRFGLKIELHWTFKFKIFPRKFLHPRRIFYMINANRHKTFWRRQRDFYILFWIYAKTNDFPWHITKFKQKSASFKYLRK